MTLEALHAAVLRFDPQSRKRNTPGDRRALAAAGLAYEVAGETGVFVLTPKGRKILYSSYSA